MKKNPNEENHKYCTYCGSKNKEDTTICKKCSEPFNKSSLRIFLEEKVLDEAKGNGIETLFSLIGKYIKENIYGVFITGAIIFSVAAVVLNLITTQEQNEVIVKPKLKELEVVEEKEETPSKITPVKITEGVILSCSNGYTLKNIICIKEYQVSANLNYNCPTGYFYNGSTCVSNASITPTTNKECKVTSEIIADLASRGLRQTGGSKVINEMCYTNICLEECNSGDECPLGCKNHGLEKIPFTYTTTCTSGSLYNGECKTFTQPTQAYSCQIGTLSGNMCNVKEQIQATVSCKKGYTLENNQCVKGD